MRNFELDAQVAEALGLPVVWEADVYYPPTYEGRQPRLHGTDGVGCEYDHAPIPAYSTSINDAWDLIEPLRKRFWINVTLSREGNGEWGCELESTEVDAGCKPQWAFAAPEAICLAVIAALKDEAAAIAYLRDGG